MHTLSQVVTPRPTVFDRQQRDVVLDLTNLSAGQIDPAGFFAENYLTQGMGQLYKAVMKRLEGQDTDGVFLLSQSMGGGKTHNLIALGLLAQHPAYREPVMGQVYPTALKEEIRVISFSGRERPNFGLWGYLAEALGKQDVLQAYYNPLQAPGQSAWINLLRGERVLLLLDELPPYLDGVQAVTVGSSNLARVTTDALTNLLAAMQKPGLENVALVLTDLSASNYAEGSAMITQALGNLKDEATRLARPFTPVEQTGDEIYNILRTRLFAQLPEAAYIKQVADAYAHEIREAKQMDITTETPEAFFRAVRESYPFHPGLKDLLARFKENPGFQQTRGLIRLMRTVVARMFEAGGRASRTYLVAAHDLDLSDAETLAQISGINGQLINAISHDIYNEGKSMAELSDKKFGGHLATDTAKLLLVASLATVQNAVRGLKDTDVVRNLCAPGVEVSRITAEILPELKLNAWYLHLDNSGKFLFKNVQNVVAKLQDYLKGYNDEVVRLEIRRKLQDVFGPTHKDCYQTVYALPAPDEVQPDPHKVALLIYEPYTGGGLHPDLQKLYDDTQYQNRLLFLTGDALAMTALADNVRGLKAVDAILGEFRAEGMAPNDPQFVEAEKIRNDFEFKFNTALTETFVKLYYPSKNRLAEAALALQFNNNRYNGEEQITAALASKLKFTTDVTSLNFQKEAEAKLFGGQQAVLWAEVLARAAKKPDWRWHKPGALDQLKDKLVLEDTWRENGNAVERGPFAPPATGVAVRLLRRDEKTGEMTLRVEARHGNRVHWEVGPNVTTGSSVLDLNDDFGSSEMHLSFLCVDTTGEHDPGAIKEYYNELTLKSAWTQDGPHWSLRLEAAPPQATISYTTNGADPFGGGGGRYDGAAVAVPTGTTVVLAGAELAGRRSPVLHLKPPAEGSGPFAPDPHKPATLRRNPRRQTTADTYAWLKLAEKHGIALLGPTIGLVGPQGYVNLETDPKLRYSAEQLGVVLNFVQTQLGASGELTLDGKAQCFERGQQLLDYIKDSQDKPVDGSEVEQ